MTRNVSSWRCGILSWSLTLGLLSAITIARVASAEPILVIPQSEFDFGYVPQSAKISHDFWLYSRGTDTLKILKVNPG
jgi:hypothetical protein